MRTLEDLFADELQDIYDAELRMAETLPKMVKKADNPELAKAFEAHLDETQGQINRLKQVFKICDIPEQRLTCQAMVGLMNEAEELANGSDKSAVRDAAMITAVQKIEHYEIASYGSLSEIANLLGHSKAASLLHKTLEQETRTDTKLSHLARKRINDDAKGGLLSSAL